jgi:enoyl-[acyl-carrier-protein] reductase (NADH)
MQLVPPTSQLGAGKNLACLSGDVGDKATGIALAARTVEQWGSIIVGVNMTPTIASKGAIHALTIQLAGEFGKYNIRTNVVAPGVIRAGDGAQTAEENDTTDPNAGLHLLNHIGEPMDVAEMVYAVAKSTFITGAIIDVDGGMAAGDNRSKI